MFKRFLFAVAVWLLPLFCLGNGDTLTIPGSWSLGGKFQTGFLIAHRPALVYLQRSKINSFEISYLYSSTGKHEWEHTYNAPLYGFAYQYFDLGSHEFLGYGQSIYPLVLFPLWHKHHLGLNIRFGIGVGYVEKRYTIKENYKNTAISTHLNGFITSGIQFRIPCSTTNQLSAGVDLSHFSNGATKLPNAGINIVTVNLGFNHFFGNPVPLVRNNNIPYSKEKETSIFAAFGLKEINPGDGSGVRVGVLTGDHHWRISRKSLLGAGADVFYDASLQNRLFQTDSTVLSKSAANFRAGIHGSYGLVVGKFRGFFQTGYYLYSKVKYDPSIYSTLSLRYFVSTHLFVCFNLKSHFAKADYFEYGIGYKI